MVLQLSSMNNLFQDITMKSQQSPSLQKHLEELDDVFDELKGLLPSRTHC